MPLPPISVAGRRQLIARVALAMRRRPRYVAWCLAFCLVRSCAGASWYTVLDIECAGGSLGCPAARGVSINLPSGGHDGCQYDPSGTQVPVWWGMTFAAQGLKLTAEDPSGQD